MQQASGQESRRAPRWGVTALFTLSIVLAACSDEAGPVGLDARHDLEVVRHVHDCFPETFSYSMSHTFYLMLHYLGVVMLLVGAVAEREPGLRADDRVARELVPVEHLDHIVVGVGQAAAGASGDDESVCHQMSVILVVTLYQLSPASSRSAKRLRCSGG